MLIQPDALEILNSPSDCIALGDAAWQKGKKELSVSLYKHAYDLDIDHVGYAFTYINALMNLENYAKAYETCEVAEKRYALPNYFSLRKIEILGVLKDWGKLEKQSQLIFQENAPENNEISTAIVEHYLLALREDGRIERAAKETNHYIDALKKFSRSRGIVYECLFHGHYNLAEDYARAIFARTGSKDIDSVEFDNLLLYINMSRDNLTWVSRNAPDVRIVSIGQSYLPFTLTKRLGLNTLGSFEENITIFDLGNTPNNTTANLFDTDFCDMFDRSLFFNHMLPRSIPIMRYKHGMVFFHEAGEYRIGNNRHRFHADLERSVDNFRRVSGEGKRLFIYSIVGPCDLNRVIDSWKNRYSSDFSRLLVIDNLKRPTEFSYDPEIRYVHIPYPDDYQWNFSECFTTNEGRAFEAKIGNIIREEMHVLQMV